MKQELVADSVHERNSYFDVDDLDYFCFRNRGKIKKPRAWAINTDPNMDREWKEADYPAEWDEAAGSDAKDAGGKWDWDGEDDPDVDWNGEHGNVGVPSGGSKVHTDKSDNDRSNEPGQKESCFDLLEFLLLVYVHEKGGMIPFFVS